ncbi:tRNA-(ms[2]io[6]A)-hydroxylase [Aurantibacillus circumpalustris]|uniref:tRNA-(ms[2]io[6]A)-hydroxylase n=1 Tax=Aurantibacillus circumpalustris TaxID=3036359 RepID=UPI00295AFBAF|nr:tRNA-(ms[2]io[6]A)-hydroxylase [Aurantibacillus circumpalustris]
MLGLKLETDPHWVNIVEKNIEEILTDHAWCEQKAATNAISIMISYPYHSDLVDELLSLAKEELSHFEMVHQKIKERGYKLGFERRDEYVNELYKFMRKGHKKEIVLIDRLLFSAMIEARSCERFRILSQHIADQELRAFYHELMISEANHYTTFLAFARKYGNEVEDVNARWQQWLDYEAEVVKNYGKQETIHG